MIERKLKHLHSSLVSPLHSLNSDMTAWDKLTSFEVTYQKAEACVINTSLSRWQAWSPWLNTYWDTAKQAWSWVENSVFNAWGLCADKCQQYGNLSWVACFSAVGRAVTRQAACFEFQGQVRNWKVVTLTATSFKQKAAVKPLLKLVTKCALIWLDLKNLCLPTAVPRQYYPRHIISSHVGASPLSWFCTDKFQGTVKIWLIFHFVPLYTFVLR